MSYCSTVGSIYHARSQVAQHNISCLGKTSIRLRGLKSNCRLLVVLKMTSEMNILMGAVVKGYHKCPFTVRTGESFVLQEKIDKRD